MVFPSECQQFLAEIIGIRVHHDLREHGYEPLEEFVDKLIVVFLLFNPSLQLHALLLVSTHAVCVLNEVAKVTIMSHVGIFPIGAFLGAATADAAPTLITRHTVLPVERRVIPQVLVQVPRVMGVLHLPFWVSPRQTWTLLVLAQTI